MERKATKDPNEFWPVSHRYHQKTRRPGFVMNIAKRDAEGKRQERWVTFTPEAGTANNLMMKEWDSKKQAADYVVWWRCTNGYDARGNDETE